ncbi:restriction endonuclease subunit S [Bifidobacterium saguinibicoloris]|uniref:restriction endonuclease subunit S n=1 Tax=Bifidobacterium saguinibicoloris TaxID=2834433 RepID=UPI001C59037F|nr:restriction endonuclease subunit S [Bifidobacterium saguinibicoloris]MBW3080124.1 restriction endonuclease subunit S [Bifidobacterium saguinibicoloris]
MGERKLMTLQDVATWGSGGTPKRGMSGYFGEGVPWLSVSDLNDDIVMDAKESLTASGIDNSSAKVVPAGTVLIAMYASIGKLGIAGRECCTSQAIAFAKPKTEIIDRWYLFHYLRSQRQQFKESSNTGTQPNISQKILKAWPIVVPDMQEQKEIVRKLSAVQEQIKVAEQMLAKADELIQSRFIEMFGDPSENPHRASVVNLGDVLSVQPSNGLYKPQKDYVTDGSGIPIVRIDSFRREGPDYGSLKRLVCNTAEVKRYGLQERDIVINRVNSVGYMGKTMLVKNMPETVVFESNMMRLHADKSRMLPEFLCAQMTSEYSKEYFENHAKRAIGQASINQKDVKGLPVLVPSLSAQTEYIEFVASVESLKTTIRQQLDRLNTLYASLTQRYFA